METGKGALKRVTLGDGAVEGLLGGIAAGAIMALFVVGVGLVSGDSPLDVLTHFDASNNASPLVGLVMHFAVAGVYGLIFGLLVAIVRPLVGARTGRALWILLGAAYGLVIYAVAEWVVLPQTVSGLRELPSWAFGTAHIIYGVVLAAVVTRNGAR